MSTFTEPPAASAPKTSSFVKLEPFEVDGPHILTVVASNYIPQHEFQNDKKEVYVAPAIEFYFGTLVNGQPRFVKTWPKSYSIKNTAFYYRLYKAVTGKEPQVGDLVSNIYGGGVSAVVTTQDKVSAKGTKYRATSVDPKSIGPVFPKMKDEIVPLAKLKPALDAILNAAKDGKAAAAGASNDQDTPF